MQTNSFELQPISDLRGFSGNANFSLDGGRLICGFEGGENSYIIRYELDDAMVGDSITAAFRLSGWDYVRYVAIGYSHEGQFRHLKIRNPRIGAWVDFSYSHRDLIWLLQNGAELSAPDSLTDLRIFIKGKPQYDGATLEVRRLACNRYDEMEETLQPDWAIDNGLQDVIWNYMARSFRDYEMQAKHFMETGQCPMPGNRALEWAIDRMQPDELMTVGTYRFSWHGLHPAIKLMLYARESGEIGALFAARAFVEGWLEQSYFRVDPDQKFAWYDHGTAERLLVLLLMWQNGVDYRFDCRFMRQLGTAIVEHARLLMSEAFYAFNQSTRYHNHAWFQDVALIAVSTAFPQLSQAEDWLATAIDRLEDQLNALIIRDAGFAVFVENSIGYHHGVQRLAEFAGDVVALSGRASEIPLIAKELVAWSEFLRYPDGRAPAQGDTFRLAPRRGGDLRRGTAYAECTATLLPKAGYGVVKGNHDGIPFMLCMFASSRCKTHKHEDNLSLTLFFDGIEWLIDPSFYSHEYTTPVARYLRSASGHNALVLEGIPYSIEPGTATLSGQEAEGHFKFSGTHYCYEGVKASREIAGHTDRLALEVEDCLLPIGNAKLPNKGALYFQCGDDVHGEMMGSRLILSHPDSRYQLCIELPSHDVELFSGLINGDQVAGVAGLGFMAQSAITTVRCGMPCNASIKWSLMPVVKSQSASMDSTVGEAYILESPGSTVLQSKVSGNGKKLNVAILGSCVSRDFVSHVETEKITYFARTSFISLASETLPINESDIHINGAFEKRMVLADFRKNAFDEISCADPNVIVIDFIDERFDVVESKGRYVTLSNYLTQSGVLDSIGDYSVLKRRNLDALWSESCRMVCEKLSKFSCPIVLNKTFWAERYRNSDTGEILLFSDAERKIAAENNKRLGYYYSVLEKNIDNIIILEPDSDLIYSDFAHKWGRDFFHFSDAYYIDLAKKFNDILGEII